MSNKYLIRLDDACPTMDHVRWSRMEELLDYYRVRPMVGIVPDCHDEALFIDSYDEDFWDTAKSWQDKGWAIALHGYDHCYVTNDPGINPMWNRSEFAGLSIEKQRIKIREGVAILKNKGLTPKYFFAPSHTFDNNTLLALKEESDIRIVSDTIGRYPYRKKGLYFVPQIIGHCAEVPLGGIYTFCFHPNTMNDNSFSSLEEFLDNHSSSFIGFDEIDVSKLGKKNMFDRFLSHSFFTYRKIRGLK